MIVCICRGASDRRVRQEIANGASSVADLRRCGIGDQCGSCHSVLKLLLAEAAVAAEATEHACTCGEAASGIAATGL